MPPPSGIMRAMHLASLFAACRQSRRARFVFAVLVAIAWTSLLPGLAHATAYTFPGNLPAGCSGSGGSYTCSALTLSSGDTISVSPTTSITVNGNFTTSDAAINKDGTTSALTLTVTGQLTVSREAVVNANITAGSVRDNSGDVTFGGSITTTSGTVATGLGSTVGGSIRSSSGNITLSGSNVITGSITSATGSIDTGNASAIGGNLGSDGTVTVGQGTAVAGTVTSRASAVSLSTASSVAGDATAHSSTLTLGPSSTVSACSRSTTSSEITLKSAARSGGVCCGTSCGTSCVSNSSGLAMPPSCAAAPFVAGSSYSFESWDTSGHYIRHANYLGYISSVNANSSSATLQDATFTARAGRHDATCWSFESVNFPGYYLRHQNFTLKLHASDGSTLFDKDTTFCTRTGLAASSGISLESINYPGYYIRHDTSLALGIAYADGGSAYAGQATFTVRDGWYANAPDHLEIHHASGAGLTCTPSTLTVVACANPSCSSLYTSGLTGTLTASGTPSVAWPSGASFTIASGSSAATVDMQVTSAGSVTAGTTGLSVTPSTSTTCNFGSPACTFTAADSGLLFDVPNHAAEASQSVSVSAVRKADNGLACVPAFASVSKSITFTCGYQNPTTGTRPVRVGGKALNAAGSSAAACDGTGQPVTLAFDTTGKASAAVQYADVGQVTLTATYTGSGSDAGLTMSGSDSFIAAPASFAFSAITAGPIKAGSAFAATLTARNSSGETTPNFGQETPAAGPTIIFTRRQPSSGVDGTFSGSFGSFSAGIAGASNLAWSEVGTGDLSASLSDYLSSGLAATGTTGVAGVVGRFIPHHFDVVVTPACAAGGFGYAGQPIPATVTARNASGGTTNNYFGAYARDTTLSDAGSLGVGSFTAGANVTAASYANGVASATPAYAFSAKQTAPQTLTIRATDTDGVSSSGHAEGSTPLRSGRLLSANGYGSEKSTLQLALRTEYWSGAAWVLNSDDTCTSVATSAAAFSNYRNHQGGSGSWTTSATAIALSGGTGTLTLAAPTGGATGTVDLALNLGSGTADESCLSNHPASTSAGLPWLRSRNGSCATGWASDPSARAAFGIYSAESKKTVHVREIF